MNASKKSNHVSRMVAATKSFMDAAAELQGVFAEAQALGYAAGGQNALADADFVGGNAFLDAATYNAVLATLHELNLNYTTGTPVPYAVLCLMIP